MNQKDERIKRFCAAMRSFGITIEEAEDCLVMLRKAIPPVEVYVKYIKENDSMNFFEKWLLIRRIKKAR